MNRAQQPVTAAMYVDGQPVEGAQLDVPNPADPDEIVGSYHVGGPEVADAAVSAAERAFPQWASRSACERAALLERATEAIEADRAELSVLLTREHGKTMRESHGEIAGSVRTLRYYAGLAEQYDTETVHTGQLGHIVERRVAMGVLAVLVPWNYPVLLASLMLAPGLIAGNTVVVKLPDYAPLALSSVLHKIAALLPPGVLNVVAGGGHDVGAALTSDNRVRKVSFTGSTETGRVIMRDASTNLKNLSLELGGNDPAIILKSAVVDENLAMELVQGAFAASGQVCYAPKRLYVHRSHFQEFLDAFTTCADKLMVGNGLDSAVTMGPVNNHRQFARLKELLAASRADGGRVVEVGCRHETAASTGYFVMPTIVTGLPDESRLVQQEQFGPVVPVLPFDDEDEVIARANHTEYGLAASIWSRDVEHAFAVARRVQAGSVFVNVHRVGASDVSMPFGGFKQSGIGRGHGIGALHEASELQILAHRTDMTSAPSAPHRQQAKGVS